MTGGPPCRACWRPPFGRFRSVKTSATLWPALWWNLSCLPATPKFTNITSDRNFGQVDAVVMIEATATRVCHIIPMAPGSPLPSGVTNLPYHVVFVVPPGFFSGIHSFVTSLVSRNMPLIFAGPCAEVKAVCDTLRGEEVSQSLSIFDIIYFTSTGAAGRYTHVQYSIVLICLNCPHGLKIP